jgi:hypothetical protein
LGGGDFTGKATVHAHHFSETAKKKIEAAGGKAELIAVAARPETKPETKRKISRIGKPQQAKPEAKPQKAEAQPEVKAEGQPEAKSEAKPEKKQKREKPESK